MALRQILKEGDPVLRKKSRPIEKIDDRLITLIDDMRETLEKSGGVGLAAVQVGVLKRVVLVDNGEEVLELINPVIVSKEGHQEEVEGCLSCPNVWGVTQRPMVVTVSAMNRNGEMKTYTGDGLTARCFCHELDHLDGILFIDHAEILDEDELEEISE
ncbi:MAG: peptide deformylase [Ruminococcaceae bacterium]|nr:peptide deformylase [Oscillospiraceae bacterium]